MGSKTNTVVFTNPSFFLDTLYYIKMDKKVITDLYPFPTRAEESPRKQMHSLKDSANSNMLLAKTIDVKIFSCFVAF